LLELLDILLTFVHLAIIGFNLTGWIWPGTRRAHLVLVLLTAASWFVLGIWFGMGYCPITDWQWRVKEQLGETNLPASFITYYAEKLTGRQFSDAFINTVTAGSFAVAAALAVYYNFFRNKQQQKRAPN
jgi:hypothetical protein